MKKRSVVIVMLVIAAGSFMAGVWVNQTSHRSKPGERKILYYVDPMNPSYRSDKPGIAPGCGMPLEPVYADQKGVATGGADLPKSLPPGTIRISNEKQQLIGVKVITVEKVPWTHTARVLGRVTPDENRIYRINAAINGSVEEVQPFTTGSLVKRDELLATIYSQEYRATVQSYQNLMKARKPGSSAAREEEKSPRLSQAQVKQMKELARDSLLSSEGSQDVYYRNVLVNFGFTDYQIKAIFSGVNPGINMEVRSPIEGFILSRNVSPGLRFDRGVEFFRIADLTKIWVLADIFENEASLYQPGKQVKIELPYLNRALSARVSKVLPQFDPATRTLKLRLEADNPGFILRPDMFVNVEIPISGPPAIIVSTEAVFDSGLKKTVFVDRGNGFFEPRPVETGRFLGERVEITKGLKPGEKIVISGNFLIDSEARLQMASSSILGKVSRDPVCGMNIDEDIARAKGNFWEYRGKMYFFCEAGDREAFRKDPERFLKSDQKPGIMTMSPDPIKTKNPKASENSRLSQGQGVNKSASHAMEEMKMTNPTDSKSSSQKSGVPMGVRNPGMGTMPASMPGNAPEPKGTMMAPLPAGPLPQPKEVGPIPQDPFPEMKKGDALPGMPAVPSDSKAVPSMPPPKAMEGEAPFPGSFPQGKGVYVPPAVNNAPEVQKGRQRVPVRRLPGMEKGSSNPGEGAGSQ